MTDRFLGKAWKGNEDLILGGLILIVGVASVELFSWKVILAFLVGSLFSHIITRYVDWRRWGDSHD